MKKKLVATILTIGAFLAVAQKNQPTQAPLLEEWNDIDIFEQNKIYPRVNVVAYDNENDIEKNGWRNSAYYVPLAGKWACNITKGISHRPDMEQKKLNLNSWGRALVPGDPWLLSNQPVSAPSIANVLDLPEKDNYIATYYREFTPDNSWKSYEAYLQLQAASAYYIWINKQFVGYSEDSRALSEFNITKHLNYGKVNSIAIQVIATSDGTLLEQNRSHSLLGITNEVAIVLKSHVNISDYTILTDIDPKTKTGEIKLTTSVANKARKGLYYLEAEIWTPQGKQLEKMAKWVAFDNRAEVDVTLQRDLANLQAWTADNPNLYTLVIRLRDNKMNLIETTGRRFGFRTVQLDRGQLLVNGTAVKLRGVAYGNYDPATANHPSLVKMRKDLSLMKRYNINAILTTVYSPASQDFYDLCDELGFYVVCEANISPYSTQKKAIAVDGDYENLFVSRVQNMYEPLKNNASIIAWSLGRCQDNGVCMERAYAALKQKDKQRPVIFPGAGYAENTDIVALFDTDPETLKTHAVKKQSRPLLLYSFGSLKGNNFGSMERVWRYVADNSRFIGGFIDGWTSTAMHNPISDAEETTPSLVSADGQVPYMQEIANLYRTFDVRLIKTTPDACEFSISSLDPSQSLGNYVLEYNMFSNLKPHIVGGEIDLDMSGGGSKTFKLKMPVLNLYIGEELFVRFSIKQRVKTAALQQGTVLASTEMSLPTKTLARLPYQQDGSLSVSEQPSGKLQINGPDFSILFDLNNADINSFKYHNNELLKAPLRMAFSRAATDNDREDRNGQRSWMHLSEQSLQRQVVAVNYRLNNPSELVLDIMVRYNDLAGLPLFDIKQTMAILSSADILIDNEVIIDQSVKNVARVGYCLKIPTSVDSVSWFGMGHETYIDRCSFGDIGTHKAAVSKLHYRYDRPQESGNHTNVRWLALKAANQGLFIDMIDTTFNFSVAPYTVDQLSSAQSYSLLKANPYNVLHVDFREAGVGSTLSGYNIIDNALIKEKKLTFHLHLRPFLYSEANPEDFRRIAYPQVVSGVLQMPAIDKDRDRFNAPMNITITSPVEGGTTHYTTDGSEPNESSPVYTKPFVIDASSIVQARTYKQGFTPSFVARQHYSYDYIIAASFDHKPNTPYNRDYLTALYDGETGSPNDLSNGWIGFSGSDLSVVLELSKEISLEDVELRFAHNPDAWTFAPSEVKVSVSADGTKFSSPHNAKITYDPTSEAMNASQLVNIRVVCDEPNVRYVKVGAKNMGKIPTWHKARGLRSWLMADEIKLNESLQRH